MKRVIFFVTLAFLLCASIALLPMQSYAQRHLTVLNHSFEQPDSGKITGFDGKSIKTGVKLLDIPGWRVDAPDSLQWDSGVELTTNTDGKFAAFLMGGDSAIYQNLTRRAYADDKLKLSVDANVIWLGTKLKMELFYLDNDTIAKANRVPIVTEVKTLTNALATYSISIDPMPTLAVGHKLGILFDNVSPDSASWLHIDNVQLTNEDPTIIEVTNWSFEQPDSGKIKGWNGPGSGYVIAESQVDIPGWTTDTAKVHDSGIDGRGLFDPQEGQYVGFLMGSDTSVWNTTDYTILSGDVITLRVLAKNVWAAELLNTELYYVDAGGNKIIIDAVDQTLNTDYTWGEFSWSIEANALPACIGKKIGIMLDNSSPTGASWIDMDYVRLNANHNATGVNAPIGNPSQFALGQNYPNPFNPTTKISYSLGTRGMARLSVYDILGREVAVLVNEVQNAGQHIATFSANSLSSGVYFYKLQTAGMTITKKMMLMK
jgi:hypothetical protein